LTYSNVVERDWLAATCQRVIGLAVVGVFLTKEVHDSWS